MPKGNEYTTKFNIDINDLKKGIQQANQLMKIANSEFKAATGGMDDWGKSADGLSAKLKQLNTIHEAQTAKLKTLENEYDRVVKAEGEGSKGAQELYIKMNNLKGEIGKTEVQIGKYSDKLNDVQKEQSQMADSTNEIVSASSKLKKTISDQEKELSDLKRRYADVALEQGESSDEAKKLAKQIEKLSGELDDNKSALKDAEKAADSFDKTLDDVGDAAKKAGDGFTVMKGALADLVASGIKSFASAIKNGLSSLANLAEETQEYREDLGKLETAFSQAKVSVDVAKDTYKDFYSVLGETDRSVEAVNHLAKFVDTEKDMATWTDICTGVWGTFGDSLPIEGLTEAANETMKTGELTGVLADALNWGAQSGETFGVKMKAATKENEAWNKAVSEATSAEDFFRLALQQCSTEQERQALITNTLNGLYSSAANSYRENNESIIASRKATDDYNEAMAKLGEKIEPVMTKVKQGFADVLNAVLSLTSDADFSQLATSIEAGFADFINNVLPAIKDGFKWIIDNKDILISGIAAIAAGFAAFKTAAAITSLISAFQTFFGVIKTGQGVMAALNLVMNANPIGLIVTAVAALVAGFIHLWNTSEEFRNFWIGLWEGIKSVASAAIDGIVNFFKKIPEFFSNIINWIKENWSTLLLMLINPFAGLFKYLYEHNSKFKEFVDNAINTIKQLPGKVWEWLSKTIEKIAQWAIDMKNKAKEAGKQFIENIINFIKQLPGKIASFLKNIISTVVSWASNLVKAGVNGAKGFFNAVVNGIKNLPRQMLTIGKNIVTGIWNGISGAAGWLGGKIKNFANGIVNTIKNALKIKSPSRVLRDQVGKFIPEGIAVGIDKNAKSAVNSMKNLAKSLMPTMDSLKDSASGFSINFNANTNNCNNGNNGNNGSSKTIIYNQYNNSPKALSRLEIYRQTKNQLSLAKGV